MSVAGKYLVRVDDVGQALDQSKPDAGLEYFLEWYHAGGWYGLPLYLGVVPGVMSQDDLALLREHVADNGGEICIHGWEHDDRVLTAGDVMMGADTLPEAECVIPPYNKYDEHTVSAIADVLGDKACPTLFGGFHGENHQYRLEPVMLGEVMHLSADAALYDRCYVLADRVGAAITEWPRVITLHHRWDAKTMGGVRRLRDAVADLMTTVQETKRWLLETGTRSSTS